MQPTLVPSPQAAACNRTGVALSRMKSSKGDRMDLTLNIEIPPLELTEDEILTDLHYGR